MATVSAVIFLYGADTKLASISIMHMDEAGATAAAAAMATLIVLTALAAKLLHLLLDRLVFGKLQAWRSRRSTCRDMPSPLLRRRWKPRRSVCHAKSRACKASRSRRATPISPAAAPPGRHGALDEATRALLAADERHFLRQSVSTPCLNAIAKAEGIYIEDVAGRRYMDFHGNNVHHIGYGHPRLKAAIAAQMDALPFAPRRYANATAMALASKFGEIGPIEAAKVLFTTGGSDAIEVAIKIARAATGRFKTLSFWDAFHGAGFGASALSGEALFRSGPAAPLVPARSMSRRSAATAARTARRARKLRARPARA